MGRQLSHLGYHLITVSRGYPSLFNGHREVLHLVYLLPTVSRGHPSLCNGHRILSHLEYHLTTVSRGHSSLRVVENNFNVEYSLKLTVHVRLVATLKSVEQCLLSFLPPQAVALTTHCPFTSPESVQLSISVMSQPTSASSWTEPVQLRASPNFHPPQ